MIATDTAGLPDKRLNAYRRDLADIRLQGLVAAKRFVEGVPERVLTASEALRRAPRPDAAQETEALFGEDVLVFETTEEGWCFVQLDADGYVGWMAAAALGARDGMPTHRVTAPRTLLFPGPDIKMPPLSGLPMGARLVVSGEAEDRNARYFQIAPSGSVVAQHLAPMASVVPDAVAVAERFLGVPYLWGGKTTMGIDCSGLVQVALGMAGIGAPRDADMQERALGRALDGGEPPRRGDLVFWKGHVGLLLGAETLLHANAHHMMVAVEPLADAVGRSSAKGSAVTSIRRL
ncbi:MAG: C40 family peptidase [Rhizobiaceae bacterium]|nr:C40 family peptidase [Rhizobiaceae bacterium]